MDANCWLLFFLLVLPCFVVSQNNGTVMVGDALIAGDKEAPWLSPSQDFAFGFHQLDSKDLFLLAIWYYRIPDKTIVWYANGDTAAPRRSEVKLTDDRGLVLTDPQGRELWKSGISLGSAAYGFMNDTGNFVIANTNSESLWESFLHPTDTLLPTQIMKRGGVLSSRQTMTNFSTGKFQFRLIPDGNAVLNTMNLPTGDAYDAYFWSNTVDSNLSNAGYQVVFNSSGYLYVLRANNERVYLTQGKVVPATENYHRATLNFDGVFTLYSHPKSPSGSGSWNVIRTMPENICTAIKGGVGTGPCGYNSICILSTDQRPTCSCVQKFSPLDPNNSYGGCKPDFSTQLCDPDGLSSSEDAYEFVELSNTDWPTSDYERYKPYNIEECKESCLQDCFCFVVVFREGTCWKKKLPLSNGRQDESVNGKAFLKVRKGDYSPRRTDQIIDATREKGVSVLVVAVLLGVSVFLNLTLVGLFTFWFSYFRHGKRRRSGEGERKTETNLRYFSYKQLVEATDGFKEELGRGSFGIVYKGLIDMGSSIPVAVKKLDRVVQDGEKEFKTEVEVIGQTHHKNLVQLLGFCNEGQHRLLVYEFLSKGTLASFLFGGEKLSWNQRIQIAFGIARGLLYLHEECSKQIIHCDIKPQNILLDDSYNARISDFGLAKLLLLDQSQSHTAIRGTKGYVAPEWFRNKPITVKVDVYSFGVMLLEIICCRKVVDMAISTGERAVLTDWAYDCFREGRLEALLDDIEALNDVRKLERFVMVAVWCIQEDASLRPTMKEVTLMLEGIVQVSVPPCPFLHGSYS